MVALAGNGRRRSNSAHAAALIVLGRGGTGHEYPGQQACRNQAQIIQAVYGVQHFYSRQNRGAVRAPAFKRSDTGKALIALAVGSPLIPHAGRLEPSELEHAGVIGVIHEVLNGIESRSLAAGAGVTPTRASVCRGPFSRCV